MFRSVLFAVLFAGLLAASRLWPILSPQRRRPTSKLRRPWWSSLHPYQRRG